MAAEKSFFENPDLGLLMLRLLVGVIMIAHGVPKLMAGPEQWEWLGSQMAHLGINFAPVFWGGLAALAETLGGALLIIGFYMRPAAFFLFGTMFIATLYHIQSGDGFNKVSHPLALSALFLALMFIGPGKHILKKSS